MGTKKLKLSAKHALPFATANKQKRQDLYIKQRKVRGADRHKLRHQRRKEEDKNPELRAERLAKNVPNSIDRKRTWDQVDPDTEDVLGLSIDTERLKRQRVEEQAALEAKAMKEAEGENQEGNEDEEADSMLGSDSEEDEEGPDSKDSRTAREPSPVQSTTSTNLASTPEGLAARFPALFDMNPDRIPKVLITTSLNSTLHEEAQLLTNLFPNSVYIPRSGHRYGHKYSVKEIAGFAANRKYTALAVLMEDQKRPCGLDLVNLPDGPMFHFSLNGWVPGKKLPGHGNSTGHYPELVLNNFRTPLGLLTAHMFRTMFPPSPEFQGRNVVTLHNQRDFIFLRRHRYIFREKRAGEKSVVGPDGKEVKGVEGIRTGLQELGPRFTLKLRRVDRGIQRSSGQEWEWKGKTDRVRTKFQL